MKSSRDANIIGFNVLVNCEGHVVTEMSGIALKDLPTVFKGSELIMMRHIISLTKPKLEDLHRFLEDELTALNHPTT